MELLSVKQAAAILDIDDSRVRQLLRTGALEGRHVGGRWLVDGHSARLRKERGSAAGRPLSVRNAWGLLAALSGQRLPSLSDAERSRIMSRLRNMAVHDELPAARLGELGRRPSLLGSIVAKSAALSIKTAPPDRHYRDPTFLLSLPMNPMELRDQPEKSDRKKLALAAALHDPQHPGWRELRDDFARADGQSAYAFLSPP